MAIGSRAIELELDIGIGIGIGNWIIQFSLGCYEPLHRTSCFHCYLE